MNVCERVSVSRMGALSRPDNIRMVRRQKIVFLEKVRVIPS